MNNQQETVNGLRALADFLEQHPDFPAGVMTVNAFALSREEFVEFVRQLGTVEKQAAGQYFWVRKVFSSTIHYELNVERGLVCTKRIVGTTHVPAHDQELVEWECADSILR